MISTNTSELFKEKIKTILISANIHFHKNQGIHVLPVANAEKGLLVAKELLYQLVDSKTILFLSGGRTPKSLYDALAEEQYLKPGGVALIDERFGKKWHENSNETMIRDTGLWSYFSNHQIPFYPILQENSRLHLSRLHLEGGSRDQDKGLNREETAESYDQKLRSLFATFPKSIGILGIGTDGHTAGIPAKPEELGIKNYELRDQIYRTKTEFVIGYKDEAKKYGERVTMTFTGLSMLDFLLVLVFGEDKKEALEKMFDSGSEEEIPARFYKRPEIAAKTLLITDQKV